MANNLVVGTAATVGAYGLYEATFKIIVAGLTIFGTWSAGGNVVGAEFVFFYDDLDLSFLGITNITIPTPEKIEDLKIRWEIYDALTGERLDTGSNSFYLHVVEKLTPIYIKKEIQLTKSVSSIERVIVDIDVEGKIWFKTVSKSYREEIYVKDLDTGFKIEF